MLGGETVSAFPSPTPMPAPPPPPSPEPNLDLSYRRQMSAGNAPPVRATDTPPGSPVNPTDFSQTKMSPRPNWLTLPPGEGVLATPEQMMERSAAPVAPTIPPIRVGFGGEESLQEYRPGESDISKFAGAPTRDTFMGGSGIPGQGTLSVMTGPETSYDIEDQAEELAKMRMGVQRDELKRYAQDPMWREKATVGIQQQYTDQQLGNLEERASVALNRILQSGGTEEDQQEAIAKLRDQVGLERASILSGRSAPRTIKSMNSQLGLSSNYGF